MNVWFGTNWGAPICTSTPHVGVPVGEPCLHCEERITADDSGIGTPFMDSVGNALVVTQRWYHIECWIRLVVGSTGHQLKLCPCFGGDYEGEPDTMSKRDAARAAFDLARSRRGDM